MSRCAFTTSALARLSNRRTTEFQNNAPRFTGSRLEFATKCLAPQNIAIFLVLLCGITRDLHAQYTIRRFGAPVQRGLPFPETKPFPQSTPIRKVSRADISAGIKRHIASGRGKAADKKFHINYRGKDLALDLVRVHDDPVSSLGGGKYFACVDMRAADRTVYDIDFFMTGQPGNMCVTGTAVHKINGKPLYNWKEEGGVWKRSTRTA